MQLGVKKITFCKIVNAKNNHKSLNQKILSYIIKMSMD